MSVADIYLPLFGGERRKTYDERSAEQRADRNGSGFYHDR